MSLLIIEKAESIADKAAAAEGGKGNQARLKRKHSHAENHMDRVAPHGKGVAPAPADIEDDAFKVGAPSPRLPPCTQSLTDDLPYLAGRLWRVHALE